MAIGITGTAALLQVTPGTDINGSTFGPNSFKITNVGTEVITQVVIDISKVLVTNARFDTSGEAGDSLATPLSLNSASDFSVITQVTYQLDNTISVSAPVGQPTTGTSDDNGFNRVVLDLQGFKPNDSFAFQLDVDPLSIQGQSGAGGAGAVSGLELSGGTFTVKSAAATASSMILADSTTNAGAAEALAVQTSASPIRVYVAGVSNGETGTISDTALNQTVTLIGPSNTAVRLLVAKGDKQAPAPDGSLGLFESNNVAEIVKRIDVTLDGNGQATVPVTLSAGGPFSFIAGALTDGMVTGQTSAPAVAVVAPLVPTYSIINGTSGKDNIKGTAAQEKLYGFAGNDTLDGQGGNDVLYGGTGNDELIGGKGNDILFGEVGNDKLDGGEGNDTLIGVDPNSTLAGMAGKGEIDTLKGGKGADLFVLGDSNQAYYNDNILTTTGLSDFALIKDFKLNDGDRIQLKGSISDYVLSPALSSLPGGTAIYLKTGASGVNELIAVVQGVNSLSNSAFTFV